MPGVPRAGPRACGAWERVPAPALLLCLHVTFLVQRKWCRGEVPVGTGHHVTSLQPLLRRTGGNPERCRESSLRTLFPSGAGRLLQHPPCSLGSVPHPLLSHGSPPELARGAGGGDAPGHGGHAGAHARPAKSSELVWAGSSGAPSPLAEAQPWCGCSSLSCQRSWLLIRALSSYLHSSKGEGEWWGGCAALPGHERNPISKSRPPQAPAFPALPAARPAEQ